MPLSPSHTATVVLRVSRCSPGLSDALSAGTAGRKWLRAGAGIHVHSRDSVSCRCWPCVEVWLYAMRFAADLGGQICGGLLSIFLAAALQGSELKAAGREAAEISINKTLFFCSLDADELDRELASSGHGDAEEDGVHVLACQARDLQ